MPTMPEQKQGLTIVYTGHGKGKTTAALGLLLRAWGRDMRVSMLQFIKSSASNNGEHIAARRIGIEVIPLGDGFTWKSKDLEVSKELALKLWRLAQEKMLSGDYDVLILDEFTYPLRYGWIEIEEVLETLRNRPDGVHIVITGRDAPSQLIDFADLVTEMKEIKHPFHEGIPAQIGIDF